VTVAPAREQRKRVTILFCNVTDSTALGESTDPEALRALFARYYRRMKGIIESHGGTVEKFIGDAVMAVFGVPVVHEDGAIRAVRTDALEIETCVLAGESSGVYVVLHAYFTHPRTLRRTRAGRRESRLV
jgi:class 3 adenylate cyclase